MRKILFSILVMACSVANSQNFGVGKVCEFCVFINEDGDECATMDYRPVDFRYYNLDDDVDVVAPFGYFNKTKDSYKFGFANKYNRIIFSAEFDIYEYYVDYNLYIVYKVVGGEEFAGAINYDGSIACECKYKSIVVDGKDLSLICTDYVGMTERHNFKAFSR